MIVRGEPPLEDSSGRIERFKARVVQSGSEQESLKLCVAGSNPAPRT
jgi:hypothetical protein